jgi:hypothetical protein
MRSRLRLAPARLSILACMALALTACVGAPPIVAAPSACSALVPKSYRIPVPGADLPPLGGATVGDWVAFADALEIVEGCEKRDAAVTARLAAPWWKRPFMTRP